MDRRDAMKSVLQSARDFDKVTETLLLDTLSFLYHPNHGIREKDLSSSVSNFKAIVEDLEATIGQIIVENKRK